MLVLSRKVGEVIWLGKTISVTVVRVEPGRVRLGFTAPETVHIARSELLSDIDTELEDEPLPVGTRRGLDG